MIGIKNYDFDNKNRWRKNVWHEIGSRIPKDRRHKALVLYLAGEQDLDRALAIKTGFNSENLIAIERDAEKARALRRAGKTTIVGEVISVLQAWPTEKPIAVIILDLCSNLQTSILISLDDTLQENNAFQNSVILLNFQRGREKDIAIWKEIAELYRDRLNIISGNVNPTMHRGLMFFYVLCGPIYEQLPMIHTGGRAPLKAPKIWSYKSTSGPIYMDSVLFSSPWGIVRQSRCQLESQLNSMEHKVDSFLHSFLPGSARYFKTFGNVNETVRPYIPPSLLSFREASKFKRTLKKGMQDLKNMKLEMNRIQESLEKIEGMYKMLNVTKKKSVAQQTDLMKHITNTIRACLAVRTMKINGYLQPSPNM